MSCLSESFLPEIPEKASESFLSEVFLPKVFRPKVFDFNVVASLSKVKNMPKLKPETPRSSKTEVEEAYPMSYLSLI